MFYEPFVPTGVPICAFSAAVSTALRACMSVALLVFLFEVFLRKFKRCVLQVGLHHWRNLLC